MRPYIGAGQGEKYKPRVQALYREVKSRERTLELLRLFWPPDLAHPKHEFVPWFQEVEDGEAKIPRQISEWIHDQLEQEYLNALADTGMEAAKTLSAALKDFRETGKPPKGGAVMLRYMQEAARDQFGKRAELIMAQQGQAKRVPGSRTAIARRRQGGPPPLRAVK